MEARERTAGDQAADFAGCALPRQVELLAAACGLDLASFPHFILARDRQ